jgi:hypothetical protein
MGNTTITRILSKERDNIYSKFDYDELNNKIMAKLILSDQETFSSVIKNIKSGHEDLSIKSKVLKSKSKTSNDQSRMEENRKILEQVDKIKGK